MSLNVYFANLRLSKNYFLFSKIVSMTKIYHCLIRLNISCSREYKWLSSSTVLKKNQLFTSVPFHCIRKQVWPWRKVGQCQSRTLIWTHFVGPTSPFLQTKSLGHRPSESGEEVLKGFYPAIMVVMWHPSSGVSLFQRRWLKMELYGHVPMLTLT